MAYCTFYLDEGDKILRFPDVTGSFPKLICLRFKFGCPYKRCECRLAYILCTQGLGHLGYSIGTYGPNGCEQFHDKIT